MSGTAATADRRIPVYLVTGFLGSGKTTLLAQWLGEPVLADAMTIVNEYGEVGLDDRLLATATDLPDMVAGGCVCCTGLSGLGETLETLFWARLHREIKQFSSVIIETTGLAEPVPIVLSFLDNPLLRERFVLKAVIVTVAATAGAALLDENDTARAQVAGAEVVVLTKTDLVEPAALDALAAAIHALHPGVPMLASARASASLAEVLAKVAHGEHAADCGHDHGGGHAHDHDHHDHDHEHHDHLDGIESAFVPLESPLDDKALAALVERLHTVYGARLLRAKGIVERMDGRRDVLQLSPGESTYDIAPLADAAQAGAEPAKLGLTIIARRA